MRRDERVFVLGEDVGVYGGAFKVTLGFQEEFGPWRVIDTPLSETAIVGGAPAPRSWACARWPRCSSPTSSPARGTTSSPSPPSSTTAPARRSRSSCGSPPAAASRAARSTRRTPRARFAHIPGLKVVCPATPEDAKGLLVDGDRGPQPRALLRAQAPLPAHQGRGAGRALHASRSARRAIHREGDDVTVITWGAMVYTAAEAAAAPRAGRRLGRDRRPAHADPVGPGGGARERATHLQGARAARGHAHRRLRRGDRGDDRRGGVRGPRRAASAASPRPTHPSRSRRRSRRRSSRRSTTSSPGSASSPRTDGLAASDHAQEVST